MQYIYIHIIRKCDVSMSIPFFSRVISVYTSIIILCVFLQFFTIFFFRNRLEFYRKFVIRMFFSQFFLMIYYQIMQKFSAKNFFFSDATYHIITFLTFETILFLVTKKCICSLLIILTVICRYIHLPKGKQTKKKLILSFFKPFILD